MILGQLTIGARQAKNAPLSTTTKTISNDRTHATPTHDKDHRETTEDRAAKSQHTLGHGPSPPLDQHPAGRPTNAPLLHYSLNQLTAITIRNNTLQHR